MMQKLKKCFILLLILPTVLLCSCSKFKPNCKALSSLSYYFETDINCEYFKDLPKNTISLDSLTNSKLNKSMINSYASFTLKSKTAETYHLYIEYIYFKIYTNESSDYEFSVNINLDNVISESDVGKENPEETTYSNTYSTVTKKDNVAIFKVYVNKVVQSATGFTLTIDILNNETYITDPNTNLKWALYDFKIYGESRAY